MSSDPAGNQSIERAAIILRALGRSTRAGARLTEVAQASGLSKSTTHRLLGALNQVGLVEQDSATGLFHLGFDLFALGAAAANRYGLVEIARPTLQRLAERTGDTIFFSVRAGLEAICVDRQEGSFPIKTLTLNVGDRRPLGVGAGSLALLAFLPDGEIASVIEANAARLAPYVNFDAATLYQLVEVSRRQGYAYNPGLIIAGMSAAGVPVMGRHGEPIASISVAAITSRMQDERRANIVTWLIGEARSLEQEIARLTEGLSDAGMRRLVQERWRG